MENATDALIMAASVLLLLIALSVCISSFSKLRMEVDEIVSEREQFDMAVDQGGEYINYFRADEDTAIRRVSVDTIMSALLRIERESYIIYIRFGDGNIPVSLSKFRDDDPNHNEYLKFTITDNKYLDLNEETYNLLYKELRNREFNEFLGVYIDDTDAPRAEKITHRIYTFEET